MVALWLSACAEAMTQPSDASSVADDGSADDGSADNDSAREPAPVNAVDFLFLFDSSSGMQESLLEVVRTAAPLLSAAGRVATVPMHVGVISTDLGAGADLGTCVGPGDHGALLQRDHGTVFRVDECEADAGRFETVEAAATEERYSEVARLIGCRGIYSDDCGIEQPLESLLIAVTSSMSTGVNFNGESGQADQANAGFLRQDSLLVIYVISDEDDCSYVDERLPGSRVQLTCTTERQWLHPVQRYVDGLSAAHDPARMMFLIHGGIPVERLEDPPLTLADELIAEVEDNDTLPTCRGPLNSKSVAPRRVLEVAAALQSMGAAVTLGSQCRGDFAEDMQRFAEAITARGR